jgi:multiphosphoryl transfer protein
MVGLVLVSHSRSLAEAVADLLRRVVSPDLRLACSGGVGDDRALLGTDAIEIQEAISAVYSEDGVLVLMDMGSAILSAETAKDFLNPEDREKVRLTSAPIVEGGMAAAVQANLGASLDAVADAALQGLLLKQEHVQDAPSTDPAQSSGPDTLSKEILDVTIQNPHGLHLRPAALLIKTLAGFPGEVFVENRTAGRGPSLARSLVDLARLQIREGDLVRFSISAPDPQPVIKSIQSLVESQFGDADQTAPAKEPNGAPDLSQPFAVSRGIAIGRPVLLETIVSAVPTYTTQSESDITREVGKLRSAVAEALAEFDERVERLRASLQRQEIEIFDAQRMIFSDPTILKEALAKIQEQHLNAAAAWQETLSRYAADQEKADDPYLRARGADFREVERTVLSHLMDEKSRSSLPNEAFTDSTILVCEELTPTLAEQFLRLSIAGVIQLGGGPTSHGAILARSLALPAIGGGRNSLERLRTAQRVAISGSEGSLWIDPSSDLLADLARRQQSERAESARALEESRNFAITVDGVQVRVGGNAGGASDISGARTNGAEFIGLFRSEFLFQNFEQMPDEDHQLAAYREALAPAQGAFPVTVRLLDVGGDKPLKFLPQAKEANPFLGVRGIRLLMANQQLFRTHLRAVLRLADSFQIQLMIPMITDLSEVLATRRLLVEIAGELAAAKVPHKWPIPLGVMIETPAAALLIDQLLPHIEFVSIGTNDLTQYILCAERGSALVSAFSDALHPAVLRICEEVIQAAQKREIKTSICGEIASDPEAIPIWLALGLRELSVTAAAIPATKALIRRLGIPAIAAQWAAKRLSFEGPADVRTFSRSLRN